MRALRIAAGILAGGLLAVSAAAQTPPAEPDWSRTPTFAQRKAAYPPAAYQAAVTGQARLACDNVRSGVLANCVVIDETPARQGFGAAALQLVGFYRLDRAPPAGEKTRFTVEFHPWDTPPDWLKRPTQDQILAVFPTPAMRQGLDGEAVIHCAITVEGKLTGCRVLSETPAGKGFGGAALSLAPQFAMRPPLRDGRPMPGGEVRIPMSWQIPRKGALPGGRLYEGETDLPRMNRFITGVRWRDAPSFAQVTAAYPEKARTERVGGAVTMVCTFADGGAVRACRAEQENPKGYGFAKAAESLQPFFRTDEAVVDGRTLKGGRVFVPVTFTPAMLDTTEPVVGKPRWAALPSGDAMFGAYPEAARRAGVAGSVQLNCRVAASGVMEDCQVAGETPAGQGFGAAGLSLSQYFRLAAWSEEGLPTIGGRVRIPMTYRLAEEPLTPPSP